MSLKIVVFLGSVRPVRMVDRVLPVVKKALEAEGITPIIFDPKVMPFEVVASPIHFMPDPSKAPKWLAEADSVIKDADGFIVLVPEYNCAPGPALLNMIDHFPPPSYRYRPCGIIAYSMGVLGGMRASTAMRAVLSEIGLITTPSYTMLPLVHNTFAENGTTSDELALKSINKVVKEVKWFAEALKSYKAKTPAPTE